MRRLLLIALWVTACLFGQSHESATSYVRTASVTLTPANLRALSDTPGFTVVPGVTGKTIVPVSVYFRYAYGSAAYTVTEVGTGSAYFFLAAANNSGNGAGASSVYLDPFFTGSASTDRQGILSDSDAMPPAVGQALKLFLLNGSNITAGDGTLTVIVAYAVI